MRRAARARLFGCVIKLVAARLSASPTSWLAAERVGRRQPGFTGSSTATGHTSEPARNTKDQVTPSAARTCQFAPAHGGVAPAGTLEQLPHASGPAHAGVRPGTNGAPDGRVASSRGSRA